VTATPHKPHAKPAHAASSGPAGRAGRLLRRMSGRDIDEAHRVSTPLELLFDLTFVVAIAAAASELHHAVADGHLGLGMAGYFNSFASIWWAWMTFTWFASAYDTDDPTYRLWTMVQMVGVLILAAGIPKIAHGDYTTGTVGYVVMRVGLVAMWLRAAREHPQRRRSAMRYAVGILVVQTLWVARLWVPAPWMTATFVLLAVAELAIPVWAAKAGHTPWHAHHIAERYGLFTIIVLGECVLGASNAVAGVLQAQGWSTDVALVGLGSVSLVLSLWWVYFLVPNAESLHHHRDRAFKWGYGHFFVFGSLAALGAFLEVVADQLKAASHAVVHGVASTPAMASAASAAATNASGAAHPAVAPTLAIGLVAAAVAVYLLTVWWLHRHIARGQARLGWAWAAAFVVLGAVVAAVAAGLPLAWALVAITAAPVVIVVALETGRRAQPDGATAATAH
jgi:low temperature requirement protein LtrA